MAGARRLAFGILPASLRVLPVTLDLLKPPFRTLPGIAGELGRKPGDGRFDCPVQQIQLVKPLEAALQIAGLNQPLNRIDRAVLTAHRNKDGRIVSTLLGELDASMKASSAGLAVRLAPIRTAYSIGPRDAMQREPDFKPRHYRALAMS